MTVSPVPHRSQGAKTVSFKDGEHALALRDLLPKWSHGIVIYNGAKIVKLADRVYGLPMGML